MVGGNLGAMKPQAITVEVLIHASLQEVWQLWTAPQHILQWNQPSDGWVTEKVENDPREGGHFLYVMKAKDGKDGFDFEGRYDTVTPNAEISYTLLDGRKATNLFAETEDGVLLTEIFEPEQNLSLDMQQAFCTSVLNNFKEYAEKQTGSGR